MKERHLSVELERFSIAEHLKVNMQHLCFHLDSLKIIIIKSLFTQLLPRS